MKRRSVVCTILLSISLIMAGEVSGSFMVDPESPVYGLPGNQDYPAISAGENSFLAVWQDKRTDDYHIYGTLISKDGSVEPCGFLISGDSSTQEKPTVAFGYSSGGEDNYLCVWWDYHTLYGTRIRENEILDPAGITIETSEYGNESPSVAYGAGKYIVVWNTWDGDIKGRTVSTDGNVSSRFDICTETGSQYYPRVSSDGTNFFVVWQDNRDGNSEIYGARVTSNDSVLDEGGIKLANATGARGSPDVAFYGYWLCVWEDTRDWVNNIYGTRVDGNGVVRDDPSIRISDNMDDANYPAISSDGEKFIVTYIESDRVWNAIVQTDGSVFSRHYTPSTPAIYRENKDVAFCDSVFFTLWRQNIPYGCGIVGMRIDTSGNFLDGGYGVEVGITATAQRNSDCAYGGDSALVVWKDYFLGIEGELIDLNGNPLKKFAHIANKGDRPVIAFTDPYYFCVWHDNDSIIKGRRITRDGVAMPETISVVNELPYTPCLDIDAGEGTFCVGWINPNSPQNVYCSILDTGGVILQPPMNISDAPPTVMQIYPLSICFNESTDNYLIAWHEMDMTMMDSIWCRMISETGGILSERVPVGYGTSPSLTFDGTNYFCVWKDGVNLIGRWINIESEPGDTCLIPFNISNPQVSAYSGGYFLTGEREDKIWGARLSPEGVLADTFEIGDGKEHSATVAGDKWFVTWSSFTPEPYSSYRIWGEFSSLTGIEEEENPKFETQSPKLVVYPNPFWERTTITLSGYHNIDTPHHSPFTLRIYDLSGRLIRTFNLSKSEESVSWDGRDINGREIQSGIYFLKVVNHNGNKVKDYGKVKIVKLR